ncbi:MAG: hypothetical protein AB7G12_07840 [Thermoanaerobaculia bacterium]
MDSGRKPRSWRTPVAIGLLIFSGWALWQQFGSTAREPYSVRPDWTAPTGGQSNFSAYTFRDRNRNGLLDLGDRAMAGVFVEISGPSGASGRSSSNLNGFVNFPMARSWRPWGLLIGRAGDYRFRVLTPPGFEIVSANGEQTSRFVELPGSISDLVSLDPTEPIGLAPILHVAGRVLRRAASGQLEAAAGVTLGATGPDGSTFDVAVAASGDFVFEGRPGAWRIAARSADGALQAERQWTVSDAPVRLSAIVLGESPPAPRPHRLQLDFENFSTHTVTKIPSGLAGLRWTYLNAIDLIFARGPGYTNTAVSGQHVAYSSSGHPVTITSAPGEAPFDFVGAYFGVGWPSAEGETLIVEASRNGAVVASEQFPLSSLGPVWFDADLRAVDRVVLRTARYWQFAVDDLVLRTAGEQPAPPI